MAKIRHIAIRCQDCAATAQMFQDTLGLELVQRRDSGAIDLSDGDVNITLLPLTIPAAGREVTAGFEHIGFTVEDDAQTRDRLLAAGARELNPIALGDVNYEHKFMSPEGLILDVGRWAGTSPIQKPAAATAAQ